MKGGEGLKKGLWSEEEDRVLMEHIKVHGKGRWNRVAKITGLKRCGKSCRLRWMNYLRPEINRGAFSGEEDELIIRLHRLLGNRWSWIAGRVPGRTDNQVKNHWNTHLKKRVFSSTKNSIASELTESINVAEQVSSNACQKMEDQKTMCTQQALNCGEEEEEFESLSWLWSNNGCNEPWDWFGHDSS